MGSTLLQVGGTFSAALEVPSGAPPRPDQGPVMLLLCIIWLASALKSPKFSLANGVRVVEFAGTEHLRRHIRVVRNWADK